MYEEGTLRPATQAELDAKFVPLERIRLEWVYECWDDTHCRHGGMHGDHIPRTIGLASSWSSTVSMSELIEYCKAYAIPYEAQLVLDGYDGELALSWTHLEQCGRCSGWYERGQEEEAHAQEGLHVALVKAQRRAEILAELREATEKLSVMLDGIADEQSYNEMKSSVLADSVRDLVKELAE